VSLIGRSQAARYSAPPGEHQDGDEDEDGA